MAKNIAEAVIELFAIYRGAIGNDNNLFDKIVDDTCSMLGSAKVTTDHGEWKASKGFKIKAKDSHEIQLPPNSSSAIMYHYALQLAAITAQADMTINASLPKASIAWVEQQAKWLETEKGQAWIKALAEKREKEAALKAEREKDAAKTQAEKLARLEAIANGETH